MKRFLNRLGYFATSALVLIFSYHYAIYHYLLSDQAHYVIEKEITTIILGDSHTETAFNDERLPNAINLSYKGESPFYSYYKLKRLLEINEHIKHVAFSFSYHSLNEFLDGLTSKQIQDYYWLLDTEGTLEIERKSSNVTTVLRDLNGRFYSWIKANISGTSPEVLNGGYRRLTGNHLNDESTRDRIIWHFISDNGDLQRISTVQQKYFNKIIQLCVENNLRFTLINTPQHPTYIEKVPTDFVNLYAATFRKLIKNHPQYVFNINLESYFSEDRFFYDGDHLNSEGSDLFTDHIKSSYPSFSIKPVSDAL